MSATTPLHPRSEILSLYSAGDLPLVLRLSIGRHVKECAVCEQQVLGFRSAKAELKRDSGAQILTGYEAIADWQALEADMLGNIRVGVAAARCIEKVGRTRKIAARLAWTLGMAALFAGGWLTRIPADDNQRIVLALRKAAGLERAQTLGTTIRSTPDGILVRSQGATLTIFHPQSAVVSMAGPAAMTARYVDDDSGQVTITNVYGQ